MKPMPQPTGIREKIDEVLSVSGKYKMGWIPEHKKEVIDVILTLISDELKGAIPKYIKENYSGKNFDEYKIVYKIAFNDCIDEIRSNLISAGLIKP